MEGLAYLVMFALAGIVGAIGLMIAVVVGIWLPLPSWAFLVAFLVPAIAGALGLWAWDR